jgi:O-antigen/teichoic acid export membrane protein
MRVLGVAALLALGIRDAASTALVYALSIGLCGLVLTLAARPALPSRSSARAISPLVARGAAIHAPALAGIGLTVINQGWVYSQLPSGDAGIFAVAAGAAATLQVLSLAELTASTVAMSEAQTGWAGVGLALRRVAGLSAIGLLAGTVVAPLAVPLVYGPAFSPAVVPFCLLLLATTTENVARVGQAALQCRGFPKIAWVVDGVRAVVLLLGMVGFGVRGGVTGVCGATAASQIAGLIAALFLLYSARGRASPTAVESRE